MYIKYKLQKKQVSHDGGVTWVDVVPIEQRIGDSAGTYSTLEECEGDYSTQYLTIESLEDNNTIKWSNGYEPSAKTISVSTDDGETWTTYTSTSGGTSIASLNTGQKVLLKGLNYNYHINSFGSTGQFKVYGNIMSLISGDTFENVDTLTNIRSFSYLFSGATGLVDAENLVLPATTLTSDCYEAMFYNCTSLTTAPSVLPATTLAYSCYYGMFYGCTSLTTAPELPATALAYYCYNNMFNGCTSLTTAPALPATTLVDACYQYMFAGCSNLSYVKCLATDISATQSTVYWLNGVASSGTFVKASSMTGWTTGTNGIPSNWTVQNA